MRLAAAAIALLCLGGCLSSPGTDPVAQGGEAAAADPLAPVLVTWLNGTLGDGAEVPLATSALLRGYSHTLADVPLHPGARRFELRLESGDVGIAFLRDGDGHLWCAARTGRVCSNVVPEGAASPWALDVVSLTPGGGAFSASVAQHLDSPLLSEDGLPPSDLMVFRTEGSGGEPTLAWMDDGRLLVTPDAGVYRLEHDGSFTDVTPLLDAATQQTLDPFMVGDPATGRIYVSQLAQCLRLSWTDDGGASWTTNPAVCAGPEQHHQKIAVGPGPTPLARTVHVATMNLASWLTTDELVIVHSRSIDGGVTWSQNPAMVKQTAGMEARAVGNIAVLDDGTIAIIAYLCDRFVDAEYNGVAVGTSSTFGATWQWQAIAPGGGRCEGIDPGIAAAGDTLYAAWEDLSAGPGHVWWSTSLGGGAWTERQPIPTGDLGSFVFTDTAASAERWVAAFLATPDTTLGPTQAPGWAHWYPYLATLDLTKPGNWTVTRLQDDPVQIGPICMDGPKCLDGARNLLDFIDVQLGPGGRAAVAYADGCEEDCAYSWQSRDSQLRVAVEQDDP